MTLKLDRVRAGNGRASGGLPPRPRRSFVGRLGYRERNLAAAVVLALLATLLAYAYASGARNDAASASGGAEVWVAKRDIPAGTSGVGSLLEPKEVPATAVVPGAITSLTQVRGLVVTDRIFRGEQITLHRFRPLAESGVRARLAGTTRAVAVAGDAAQVLAGIVRAGDRVDVLAAIEVKSGTQTRAASRVLLRDLLVLRAPADESGEGVSRRGQQRVVLAMTDIQAQKLFYVIKHGEWSLALRPVSGDADSSDRIDNAGTILSDGIR